MRRIDEVLQLGLPAHVEKVVLLLRRFLSPAFLVPSLTDLPRLGLGIWLS